jgi:S1-C subfamily serine protease
VVALQGDPASIVAKREDDWAVVKVPGMDPAWPTLDLAAAPTPKPGDLAYILQHPSGQRKRLGFVRNTISDVSDRVLHYLTDTQPGSSGAPVFDAAGHLVGLHHAGGEPTEVAGKPPVSKNEGIRISRVLDGLKAQNLLS